MNHASGYLKLSLLFAAALTLGLPATSAFAQSKPVASAEKEATLDPTQFKWSSSAQTITDELQTSLKGEHVGKYTRYQRSVSIASENWKQFFVFSNDKLIAQGYTRTEHLVKPRMGTISDVVSYDNNHKAARFLSAKLGEPAIKKVRTNKEYSEEMGDDSLRATRSLDWDLLGERYRWELKNGTVRYTIQYSMDGIAEHRIVNINPRYWSQYFDFMTDQAFRDAGVQRVRTFRERAQNWVTASFSPAGKMHLKENRGPSGVKPRSAQRTQWSSPNCNVQGKSCTVTYYFYGGLLYQTDVDFSRSGKLPRRGHNSNVGEAFYKRFAHVDSHLKRYWRNPQDTKIITDMDNKRSMRKAENLVRDQEGFWSVWFDAPSDTLIRHVITGKTTDFTDFHVDHKLTYRLHSVARALAERDEWNAETAKLSSN
ncbi:hypothetical protein [Bradymonas sediminis]|uniref:hypothetical protein n=1 Tax=Bradymonas sediminis TaxID=1548548 RepID=UPI00105EC192|nr:hypothetical protein [Bradymonas sediminis]